MTTEGQKLLLTPEEADVGSRLDSWLAARLPELSRTRLQVLIRDGCVLHGGRTHWRPRDPVMAGAYEVAEPPPQSVALVAEAIPLDVIFEDADLIVINKPPGMVVHPAPGHSGGTLVNALLYHCHDLNGVGGEIRPGIVHRLDKDTSGVMVAAKHQRSMDKLAAQFQSREIRKSYVAVVAGLPNPAAGCLETEIGRSRHDRKKMSVYSAQGKQAITHYRLERVLKAGFCVVRLRIETGRTHQIRVQMAHIGCPVAGDSVYGGTKRNLPAGIEKAPRQMLHAEVLSFLHPASGQRVEFSSPIAPDMQAFIRRLES